MNGFNRTFALLIIIVGLGAGFLYYTQIASDIETIPPIAINQKDTLSQFKDFDLSFDFTQEATYKNLRTFGEFPVSPGTVGKRDIFAPF